MLSWLGFSWYIPFYHCQSKKPKSKTQSKKPNKKSHKLSRLARKAQDQIDEDCDSWEPLVSSFAPSAQQHKK